MTVGQDPDDLNPLLRTPAASTGSAVPGRHRRRRGAVIALATTVSLLVAMVLVVSVLAAAGRGSG